MPVTRLNHAVLYVRDVERTREFYENVLGFKTLIWAPGQAAFFQAPGLHQRPRPRHLPDRLRRRARRRPAAAPWASTTWPGRSTPWPSWPASAPILAERGALTGASDHVTTKALYAQDPDGIEFEVSWLVPADLITDEMRVETATLARPRPLDLEGEIARYGAETRGGVGVSVPVG